MHDVISFNNSVSRYYHYHYFTQKNLKGQREVLGSRSLSQQEQRAIRTWKCRTQSSARDTRL